MKRLVAWIDAVMAMGLWVAGALWIWSAHQRAAAEAIQRGGYARDMYSYEILAAVIYCFPGGLVFLIASVASFRSSGMSTIFNCVAVGWALFPVVWIAAS